MTQTIDFVKASGAGNDFVLINNMHGEVAGGFGPLAVAACSRHTGVGADGLILIQRSSKADFAMLYYNADGSYGGMCGNGGRCAARFANLLGVAGPEMRFEALDHVYQASICGDSVQLKMKDPKGMQMRLDLPLGDMNVIGDYVDTGAPHLVLFVDELENLDVTGMGLRLRNHRHFHPNGTNVNFVRLVGPGAIRIRTYERGVEAETLACGTGSVASALLASVVKGVSPPVTVQVRSGEELRVDFRSAGGGFSQVTLEGSAHMLFAGRFQYDDQRHQLVDAPQLAVASQLMSGE